MTTHIVLVFGLAVGLQQGGASSPTGALEGVVRDQHGGVIRAAAVTLTCGNVVRRTMTNNRGEFEVGGLPAGRCTVTAAASHFETQFAQVEIAGHKASAKLTLPLRAYSSEVVVTPGRGIEEDGFRLPESISVVTRSKIDSRPYQLLPQVLNEEPGILVQQTTSGQTSPIIRGFTGQGNVYLVDGVRLNTAAWRTGPSQYLGWIDGAAADRLEIVRGPGSVEYGSDALGGTINVLTPPSLFTGSSLQMGGGAEATFGAADRSAAGEVHLHLRARIASLRAGGSRRSVGDLRAGGGRDSHAAVTRFLGVPSTVLGTRMRATGYQQSGALLAGSVSHGTASLNGLYVHSAQDGASRYDRLLGGDGNFRSGLDPQRLDFGFVKYQRPDVPGFDGIAATISLNRQADGRFEQARPMARIDEQNSVTTVLGYQLQGHRQRGRHRLLAGAEFYDERTTAARHLHDRGVVTAARPDIPDGTTYTNLGLFVQHSVDVLERVNLRGGLRYGRFGFATTADDRFGVTAERVTSDALTFQAGTVVSLTRHVNLVGRVSRGFRAANAADLGDIGLTGGGGFIITPSKAAGLGGLVGTSDSASAVSTGLPVPALGPEVLYSYEAGLKFQSRRVNAAVTVYDLEYFDTIQRRAIVFESNVVGTTISGFEIVRQDGAGLAYIAQDVRPIGTRVNSGRARIAGFDLQADARVAAGWTAAAYFSMSNGRLLATGDPLRRMPPPLGGARVRWASRGTWVEGALGFGRPQTRLSVGDLGDARIGALRTRTSIANFWNGTASDLGLVQGGVLTATGETLAQVQERVLGVAVSGTVYTRTPGFVVVGLRGGWAVSDGVELTLLGENLTDRNYRLHGSGVDSPGANVQARVRYRF